MRKLQAPISKLQRNFKLQIPNSRGKTVETVRKDRGGATTARFSAPGTYLLRVVAADRSAANALVHVTVTP